MILSVLLTCFLYLQTHISFNWFYFEPSDIVYHCLLTLLLTLSTSSLSIILINYQSVSLAAALSYQYASSLAAALSYQHVGDGNKPRVVAFLVVIYHIQVCQSFRSAAVPRLVARGGLHVGDNVRVVELLQPHGFTHTQAKARVEHLRFQDHVIEAKLLEAEVVVFVTAVVWESVTGLSCRTPVPLDSLVTRCRDSHGYKWLHPQHVDSSLGIITPAETHKNPVVGGRLDRPLPPMFRHVYSSSFLSGRQSDTPLLLLLATDRQYVHPHGGGR